jgi:hypothetical protein
MISKNYKFEKEMEEKKSERVFKRNLCANSASSDHRFR